MTAPAREAERLGELLKTATPGPWLLRTNRHTSTNGESWGWISPDTKQNDNLPGLRIEWNGDNRGKPNAALIVAAVNALPGLLAERAALLEEIERLRRELMAAVVADQEHGAGMSIILRNWRSHGKPDGDWRALDVSVQFGVGQPEISVISEYLCEGGVIDHAVHPSGIASARARAIVGGQADGK